MIFSTITYYQSSQLGQEYPKLQMLSLMISSTISGANSRYNSQPLAFDNIVSLSFICFKKRKEVRFYCLETKIEKLENSLFAICKLRQFVHNISRDFVLQTVKAHWFYMENILLGFWPQNRVFCPQWFFLWSLLAIFFSCISWYMKSENWRKAQTVQILYLSVC